MKATRKDIVALLKERRTKGIVIVCIALGISILSFSGVGFLESIHDGLGVALFFSLIALIIILSNMLHHLIKYGSVLNPHHPSLDKRITNAKYYASFVTFCILIGMMFFDGMYILRTLYSDGSAYKSGVLEIPILILLIAGLMFVGLYLYHRTLYREPTHSRSGWSYSHPTKRKCVLCYKHPTDQKYHLKKVHNLKDAKVDDYYSCCECNICIVFLPPRVV
jgi:hypothetical protein